MVALTKDPCFPSIAQAMDTGLVRLHVQAALFPPETDTGISDTLVVSCEIKNLRHKLGKRFVLCYQLELLDTQTGLRRNQLVSASLCNFGHAPPALGLVTPANNSVQADTVASDVYIDALAMHTWVFPKDKKLRHLPQAVDSCFIKAHLGKLLPTLDCAEGSWIKELKVDILQYLPERSCMMRYCLTIIDPTHATPRYRILYGKNYPDDSGGQIYSVMQELAEQLRDTARPLAYDAGLNMLWQSHVQGIPLEWRDLLTAKGKDLLQSMAASVAGLQGCRISTPKRYGLKDIDEQLLDTVNAAKTYDAHFAERISNWVGQLIGQRKTLAWPETPLRPLHQDLHLCNFLVSGYHLNLIDFDTVCLGDPLADIGSLLANFYRCGLYVDRDIDQIDSRVQVFLAYYQDNIAWQIDRPRMNWFIAAALVHEVIRRIIRQQHESGLPNLHTYLELSRRYAGLASKELACA